MKYQSEGPAVMLGDSTSIFPAQLAAYWRSKGIEVVLVTHRQDAPPTLPDGTRIVRSLEHETFATKVARRLMNPILYRLEKTVPRYKGRFTRITGMSADSNLRLPYFAPYVREAWPTMRAARAQRPRFVFGHEVTTYGLATALCWGIPRIIFPWGGDVFTYAESSPFHFALTRFALRTVDLIVPSSTTAAHHICERFGIPSPKVHAVSWGVDRQEFQKAGAERRRLICARWRIDPDATIILNPRRFQPDWGAWVALEAFTQIASENPSTHLVLFGGRDTEQFTQEAQRRLQASGLSQRSTVLEGDAPLEVCAELMSVSDIFVSLLGRGDMRSASVLQAAAAGGVPIVSDSPEYREMERLGFAALFVQPDNVEEVVTALRFLVQHPDSGHEMATRNDVYLDQHENYSRQMDKMLSLIDTVCDSYLRQ